MYQTKKAFTMVELITVIAIVMILIVASISLMNPAGQERDAKNQAAKNKLDTLEQQINTYKLKNGIYPPKIN